MALPGVFHIRLFSSLFPRRKVSVSGSLSGNVLIQNLSCNFSVLLNLLSVFSQAAEPLSKGGKYGLYILRQLLCRRKPFIIHYKDLRLIPMAELFKPFIATPYKPIPSGITMVFTCPAMTISKRPFQASLL